jgi:hypothetical protein
MYTGCRSYTAETDSGTTLAQCRAKRMLKAVYRRFYVRESVSEWGGINVLREQRDDG